MEDERWSVARGNLLLESGKRWEVGSGWWEVDGLFWMVDGGESEAALLVPPKGKKSFTVAAWNPTGHARTEMVRIPVVGANWRVLDGSGKQLRSQAGAPLSMQLQLPSIILVFACPSRTPN